jgi:hypothetical protein
LPRRGERRVDELRQEGGKEDNRLRVRQGDEDAAREIDAVPSRRRRASLSSAPLGLDAEVNQIGRAGPAQELEQENRVGEHPRISVTNGQRGKSDKVISEKQWICYSDFSIKPRLAIRRTRGAPGARK